VRDEERGWRARGRGEREGVIYRVCVMGKVGVHSMNGINDEANGRIDSYSSLLFSSSSLLLSSCSSPLVTLDGSSSITNIGLYTLSSSFFPSCYLGWRCSRLASEEEDGPYRPRRSHAGLYEEKHVHPLNVRAYRASPCDRLTWGGRRDEGGQGGRRGKKGGKGDKGGSDKEEGKKNEGGRRRFV
jgi:hypothetical protein